MSVEASVGGAGKSSRSGSDRGDKRLGSRKWSPGGGCTRAAVVSNGYRVIMGRTGGARVVVVLQYFFVRIPALVQSQAFVRKPGV